MRASSFTVEQLSAIRRELIEGHAVKLAVTATSLSWIIQPDVTLAFWDDRPLSASQQQALSIGFHQLINKGFQFACLTPAHHNNLPFGMPTRKAA